ncbi:integrase [Luteibacter sp. HA06]
MTRPSGLYARYFVPVFLQPAVGSRYLVLSLYGERRDAARFTAARIGYLLSRLFEWMRKNPVADPKDLLTKALNAARNGRELVIDLPDGTRITTDGSAADYEAAKAIVAERERVRLEAGVVTGVASPVAAAAPSDDGGDLMSLRVDKHLAYLRSQELGAKNVLDYEYSLKLFIDLMGDKTVTAVSSDDIESYLAMLVDYPPNASKKKEYRELLPKAALDKARADKAAGLSLRTREKHLDRLRAFFGRHVKQRRLPFNPCDGFSVSSKAQDQRRSREPFTPAELTTVFDHLQSLVPHQYWPAVLALYSGARVNEIGQLECEDIEEIAGIWGMHIRRKTKNEASRRFVPLHPEVIRLGFLDYVRTVKRFGFATVFAGIDGGSNGPGDVIGDWFNRTHLRKHCKILSPSKVFHSFRHTFATAAERAGVPDGRPIGQLTGHSTGGTVLRDHYIQVATLPDRLRDISKVKYPTVKLTPKAASLFEHYLRRERALQQRAQRTHLQN